MTFLVFSNLFIAVSAAAFAHASYYLLGAGPRASPVLALVFCATLVVYNLDRLSTASDEDAVDATERHRWVDRHRRLLVGLGIVATVGVVATLFFVPREILYALVPLGVASLGYSLPVVWGRSGPYRLKDIAGLKIFLIAFVWTGATAFLPAVELYDDPFRPAVAALCLERALFVFAITLPFDIRDMARDRAAGIWTIPLMIGRSRTRTLALTLLGTFALCVVLHYGVALASPTLPLVSSAALTGWLLWRADRQHAELYYVGKLDGMMALQAALVALHAAIV